MIGYQENIGLVHHIARKLFGWTQSLNLPMDYDDVFQEVSLAFVTAAANYDESQGVKFSAYLSRAAHNQIRKTVGVMTGLKRLNEEEKTKLAAAKEANETSDFIGLSFTSFEDMTGTEEGSALDIIPSSQVDTADSALFQSEWEREMKKMSPLAKAIIGLIQDPPKELVEELNCQYEHAKIAVSMRRAERAVRVFVSLRSVCDFLTKMIGCSRETMIMAEAELLNAASRVNNGAN